MSIALKKRLNISLSDETREFLNVISEREKKPAATKARELLELALEIEEDYNIEKLIQERASGATKKIIAHDQISWD